MSGELQERLGANESVFREINEAIERGQWPGDEAHEVGFRCECARLGCNRMLELPVSAYEKVRAHPRRFIIVPGHQVPDIETVVEEFSGYAVVEKRGAAGERAERSDPRA
jgi:hypothetical protein